MPNEQILKEKENDSYLQPRRNPPEWEIRLFLHEVEYSCPLCGKLLQHSHQKKLNEKLFQIAHIYPNSPTDLQYVLFYGLERLGEDCESHENKIALCKDCHGTQDFQTSTEDYLRLLEKRKYTLKKSGLENATISLGIEDEIGIIIESLQNLSEDDISDLCYLPTQIVNKFEKSEMLLKNKISGYVTSYFPYIRDKFKELEQDTSFSFQVLSCQIKACFLKMEKITTDKNLIFESIVKWMLQKTSTNSIIAAEIIVSFFVQNCEVFHEITK